MYLWKKYPEILKDLRTDIRRTPTGDELELPVRHSLYTNTYAFMAWGMERLIDLSPRIWEIFIRSRQYGALPTRVHAELKIEVDKVDSRLYNLMNATSRNDLRQVMTTTQIIDVMAKRYLGR